MKVSLVVLNAGKSAGHAIPVTLSQFTIGRDPQCNLRPASAMISKRHCAILIKNGKVSLRDFDSTNGTFLNDKQVKGEVPLQHNDIMKVGPLAFKVVVEKTVTVEKPTPLPAKSTKAGAEEDVAAMLLSLKDEDGTADASPLKTQEEVPGGSTVMDMVALPNLETAADPKPATPSDPAAEAPAPAASSATPPPATKEPAASERKPPEKKQPPAGQHGSARDAAKAILEKYSKRNRG